LEIAPQVNAEVKRRAEQLARARAAKLNCRHV
jgi:hypothetical protein